MNRDSVDIDLDRIEARHAEDDRLQAREDRADYDRDVFDEDTQRRLIERVKAEQANSALQALPWIARPARSAESKRLLDAALANLDRQFGKKAA